MFPFVDMYKNGFRYLVVTKLVYYDSLNVSVLSFISAFHFDGMYFIGCYLLCIAEGIPYP
jgi:hypothetical protein